MVSLKDPEVTAAIIDDCRRGDREAFRLLYEAYKDKVYSMALYFFHGDTTTAADVTQQVFLKLIENIRQFRGDASFSTWLYRFVVNACVDRTRAARTRMSDTDPSVLDTMPTSSRSQEDDVARAEIAATVQSAVSALSPKIRMAILLRYFDDLSYAEMASALNCSIGTVASRLSRGHELLAQSLASLRIRHD